MQPAGGADGWGGRVLLQSEVDKLKFLRAVETLSGAVHAQADGTMDDYFPKTILAKKIEVRATLMLLGGWPSGDEAAGPRPGGPRLPLRGSLSFSGSSST